MVWPGKRGIGSFWSMFLDECLSSRMSLGAVVMRNVFDQGWWQQRWLHVSAHTAVGKCWKAILLHLTKGRKLVSIWHLQAEEKLWKLLTTTLQTASPIIMSFKKKLGSLASNKIWESSKRKYCEVKSGCLHFGRQSSTNFLAWIKVVSPGDVICLQPSQRCRCQHPHPARLKDRLMFHEPLTTTWLSHVKKVSSSPPQNMTRAVVMRNVFDQGWWQQRWLHVSAHTAVGKCWKAILLHLTKGRKLVSIWHLQAEEKLWKLLTTTLQTASPIIMSFKKKLGSLASNKIWESSKRKYCEVKSGCLHFGRQNSTLRSCATKFARHCSKKHMGSDRHVCSWKRS